MSRTSPLDQSVITEVNRPVRSLPIVGQRASSTNLHEALLREVLEGLQRWLEAGRELTIDLTSLPMTDDDRRRLETRLGKGEVQITLSVAGDSEIWETRFAGVWWVRHKDPSGSVIAETLEVTPVPRIVRSQLEDMAFACQRLANDLTAEGFAEERP